MKEELKVFSVWSALRQEKRLQVTVQAVAKTALKRERRQQRSSRLSNPDLSVLVLMRRFPNAVVLTDDLELRRVVEASGYEVTGSVGLVVRGYRQGHLSYEEMERAITRLLDDSSLYLSRAFRKRVLELVRQIEKEKS